MPLMTVQRLGECASEYARVGYGDSKYFRCLALVQPFTGAVNDTLLTALIDFLNSWQCRLKDTEALRAEMTSALSEVAPFLLAAADASLEATDLRAVLVFGDRRMDLRHVAHHCFDRLFAIGNRFATVATAKTLHVLCPRFFVMWDDAILAAYRSLLGMGQVGCDGWFYAYAFLPRMQQEISAVLEEASQQAEGRGPGAPVAFGTGPQQKSLAKLADEFNYIMFTRGKFTDLLKTASVG